MRFGGYNVTPETLTAGLGPNECRHGLSDGSWSLIELIAALTRQAPAATAYVATWSAAVPHLELLRDLQRTKAIQTVRLLLDVSLPSRTPHLYRAAADLFGTESIRLWKCHAKFALFLGGSRPAVVHTSANLNPNRRIENFTVWTAAEAVAPYEELAARVERYDDPLIAPGTALHTRALLGRQRSRQPRTIDDLLAVEDWILPTAKEPT